jgi:hypothetical protein
VVEPQAGRRVYLASSCMTVDRSPTGKSKQLQFCGELTTCLLSVPAATAWNLKGTEHGVGRRQPCQQRQHGKKPGGRREGGGWRRLMHGRDVTGRGGSPHGSDRRALNQPWKLRSTKRLFAYPCDWDPARKHTCHCATFQSFLDNF